ncbi:MAG TPA: hypothetical protein VEX60_13025 [Pyrinomonadaceae bacterium]|nr:hypothetical protein [Pyrinomonadaceae bacterium]
MEVENSFRVEEVEARGAVCVECLAAVALGESARDRCGATLCPACAAEFYEACAACGGLVPRDEALARTQDGALCCVECFGRGAAGEAGEVASLTDEEVAALVAEYVALHEEIKRLDSRAGEIKEQLKLAARSRPRISNAVVLRAGEGAGVRCSYAVKTAYDAEKLSAAERLLGEEFAAIFERKVTFSAVKGGLEEFMSSTDEARAAAREAVRAAEQRTEVATLTVVAQKGRSAEGKRQKAKGKGQK